MIGELIGLRGSARCEVRIDADGAAYISNVVPPLLEGDYQLLVNGLPLNVRFDGDCWQALDE